MPHVEALAAPNTFKQESDQVKTKSSFLLGFEEALVEDMSRHRNCMVILARGFSVPKVTASLLFSKYSLPTNKKSANSPFLIFLLNFDEIDFASLQSDLNYIA